jgi:hypothetical protein
MWRHVKWWSRLPMCRVTLVTSALRQWWCHCGSCFGRVCTCNLRVESIYQIAEWGLLIIGDGMWVQWRLLERNSVGNMWWRRKRSLILIVGNAWWASARGGGQCGRRSQVQKAFAVTHQYRITRVVSMKWIEVQRKHFIIESTQVPGYRILLSACSWLRLPKHAL